VTDLFRTWTERQRPERQLAVRAPVTADPLLSLVVPVFKREVDRPLPRHAPLMERDGRRDRVRQ
jgi:hypothetical protein